MDLIKQLERHRGLLDFCEESKLYFRQHNNTIGEELYTYLAYKVGVMYEMMDMYIFKEMVSPQGIVTLHHGVDVPMLYSKLFEVQTLFITHYISLIESMLRKSIQNITKKQDDILISETSILHALNKSNDINEFVFKIKLPSF